MGSFLSGQGSSGVVMGQDVGKVPPLLGQCLGTPLAEPHAMAVAFCGKIKTDEPRTLDFSWVRGFLVTNVCIVQRSAA